MGVSDSSTKVTLGALLLVCLLLFNGLNIALLVPQPLISKTSAKKNLTQNYSYATFTDDFDSSDTGYDSSFWHPIFQGDGYFDSNNEHLTLNVGVGGYHYIKSRKIFDIETTATIEFSTSIDKPSNYVDTYGNFVSIGWSSSIPDGKGEYDWNLDNSENAIFIENNVEQLMYTLKIIKNYVITVSVRFTLDSTDFQTISLQWGQSQFGLIVNGEPVIILDDISESYPETKMFFYAGLSSEGWPYDGCRVILNQINFEGHISNSGVPFFVEAPSGYLFMDQSVPQKISWVAEDDDPTNYIIFKDGNELESGTWSSNVPITLYFTDLDSGFNEFLLRLFDEAGNVLQHETHTKTVDKTYYDDELFTDGFIGNSFDSNNWEFYEKEGSTTYFQDEVLSFEGGGSAIYRVNSPTGINTAIRIRANLFDPTYNGGSGIGLSDIDYLSSEFIYSNVAGAPHIEKYSDNCIYLMSSFDGSHYTIVIKSTPTDSLVAYEYHFNFYIEHDNDFEDFLIIRNQDGIEIFLDNLLMQSFSPSEYVLPEGDLFFSAYATSWGKYSLTELDSILFFEENKGVIQNGRFSYIFSDNSDGVIKSINIGRSGQVGITTGNISSELHIDLQILAILTVVVSVIITTIILLKRRQTRKFR